MIEKLTMNDKRAIDLTTGSIPRILIRLATPIIVGMVLFTLYFMVDLYFVGRLGPDAVAAVSISGNAFFVILGLAFVLGTGGMALMARAVGKRDVAEAGTVFRQTLLMTVLTGGGGFSPGLDHRRTLHPILRGCWSFS